MVETSWEIFQVLCIFGFSLLMATKILTPPGKCLQTSTDTRDITSSKTNHGKSIKQIPKYWRSQVLFFAILNLVNAIPPPPPFLVGQTNSRDKRPGKNQSRRRRQQDIMRSIGVTVCRIFMKNYYPKTKMEPKNGGGWKMTFLFKQVIFRFHVSFREVESFRYVVSKSKRGSTAKKDDTFSRSFHENAPHNLIGAFNIFFWGTYVKHVFFLLLEIQVVNQIVSSFQSVVVFLGVSKKVKYTPQKRTLRGGRNPKRKHSSSSVPVFQVRSVSFR